jgi:carbon storage regulator
LLVLRRKTNESLLIGENITITILGVEGEHVKIGIDAPREIPIIREELIQAVQQQSQKAANMTLNQIQDQIQVLKDFLIENLPADEKTE